MGYTVGDWLLEISRVIYAGFLFTGIGFMLYLKCCSPEPRKVSDMLAPKPETRLEYIARMADQNNDGVTSISEWKQVYQTVGVNFDELQPKPLTDDELFLYALERMNAEHFGQQYVK